MANAHARTPEEALRASVDALGGLQKVGHRLRPEIDPILAGQWLAHCVDPERREKLTLAQIVWIFREAKAAGAHVGFESLAQLLGYRITAVVDEREQLADLARKAQAAAHEATTLSAEVLARMQHANLKVDS